MPFFPLKVQLLWIAALEFKDFSWRSYLVCMQTPCEDGQTSQRAWQGLLAVAVGLSTAALPPAAGLHSAPGAAGAQGAQSAQPREPAAPHGFTERLGLEGTFKVTEFQALPRAGCSQQIRLLWAPPWMGTHTSLDVGMGWQCAARGQQHKDCCRQTVNLCCTWPQAPGYKTAGENTSHIAGCLAIASR